MSEPDQNYTWDPDRKEVCMQAPRLTFTKQDLMDMARAMPQPERPKEHQVPNDRIQAWSGTDGKIASLEIHVNLLKDFLLGLGLGIYTMTADEILESNSIITSLTEELADTKAQLQIVTEQCRLEIEFRNALTKVFNEKMEEDPHKRANDLECKTSDLSTELDKSRKWATLLEGNNRQLRARLEASQLSYNQLGRRLQAMREAASMCNLRSELGILIDDLWP